MVNKYSDKQNYDATERSSVCTLDHLHCCTKLSKWYWISALVAVVLAGTANAPYWDIDPWLISVRDDYVRARAREEETSRACVPKNSRSSSDAGYLGVESREKMDSRKKMSLFELSQLTLSLPESNIESIKCGCTFWDCWWNPSVWPFKWKLLSSTFRWYCLFLTILQNEIQLVPRFWT